MVVDSSRNEANLILQHLQEGKETARPSLVSFMKLLPERPSTGNPHINEALEPHEAFEKQREMRKTI